MERLDFDLEQGLGTGLSAVDTGREVGLVVDASDRGGTDQTLVVGLGEPIVRHGDVQVNTALDMCGKLGRSSLYTVLTL